MAATPEPLRKNLKRGTAEARNKHGTPKKVVKQTNPMVKKSVKEGFYPVTRKGKTPRVSETKLEKYRK
jgi:predicted secreted protein